MNETAILSEKSLTKAWLSKEDEEAFACLQKKIIDRKRKD
jgi:hypothetical protein